MLVMKTSCGSTALEVFAGGAKDAEGVASVQRSWCWEGGTAAFVRPTVEDLVVGIA